MPVIGCIINDFGEGVLKMKFEIDVTKKQIELIQDALQGYLNATSDFLTYDEYVELNILASDFLAQIPDKLYEEG